MENLIQESKSIDSKLDPTSNKAVEISAIEVKVTTSSPITAPIIAVSLAAATIIEKESVAKLTKTPQINEAKEDYLNSLDKKIEIKTSVAEKLIFLLKDSKNSLLSAIQSLNPFGIFARFKTDFQTLKHAALEGCYEKNKADISSLSKSINGRIFASLLFSDICSYAGAPVGAAVQIATGNWMLGLGAGILSAYAIAVASFQAAYAYSSSDIYKHNSNGLLDFIKKLEKDLFPIHKKCFYAAAACNLVAIPICLGTAELINLIPLGKQPFIPISFIETLFAITVFDALFVKSMSDFNRDYSNTLAERYLVDPEK